MPRRKPRDLVLPPLSPEAGPIRAPVQASKSSSYPSIFLFPTKQHKYIRKPITPNFKITQFPDTQDTGASRRAKPHFHNQSRVLLKKQNYGRLKKLTYYCVPRILKLLSQAQLFLLLFFKLYNYYITIIRLP